MAATTMTYTLRMSENPKKLHAGVSAVVWDFNSGATAFGTLSDVLLLGKIPNGALLLAQEIRFGAIAGVTAQSFALLLAAQDSPTGTLSTYANLMGSISGSTAAVTFRSARPVKVSLSDDRAVQYVTLLLNTTTGTSQTVSFSTQGFVTYLSDGSNV